MENIEKPKFQILDATGSNYLSWCLDIKLHLQGYDIAESIVANGKASDKDKMNALILLVVTCMRAQRPSICLYKILRSYGQV